MKTIHLALLSLLLFSSASPTWQDTDPIPAIPYSRKALGTMLAACVAISIATGTANTPDTTKAGLACLTGLATACVAEVTESGIMATTKALGLEEDTLFIKQKYKTGFGVCILRRLIAVISSNVIREKLAGTLSSPTNPDHSTLLLTSSRSMTALLFTLRHLIDKDGLIGSSLTYWEKWNKKLHAAPGQMRVRGVGSLSRTPSITYLSYR